MIAAEYMVAAIPRPVSIVASWIALGMVLLLARRGVRG